MSLSGHAAVVDVARSATAPLTLGTWTLLVPVAFVTRSLLFRRAIVDNSFVIVCPNYVRTRAPLPFVFRSLAMDGLGFV